MTSLMRIWTIGCNTLREAIRNKLLYTLLFFAVTLIGTGLVISSISYVERSKILQDVGLASIRLFSVGIAIFVGVGLIHGEVYRRTIYTILSKPVSRSEFLVGKYVGLVMTIWLQIAIMTVAFVLVSVWAGAPLDWGHASALVLIAMELAIVVAVATLFSAFTTPMLASLFTLGIYMMGHLTRDLLQIGQQAETQSARLLAKVLFQVLPDLEAFNLSVQAVHQLPISPDEVWKPILYGAGYAGLMIFAGTKLINRRDFR
jgi:ABC-type transport system involved in multi-copper enzyme maturation permease subunit